MTAEEAKQIFQQCMQNRVLMNEEVMKDLLRYGDPTDEADEEEYFRRLSELNPDDILKAFQ